MADIFAFKMGEGLTKRIWGNKEKLWVIRGFFKLIIGLGTLTHIYEILFILDCCNLLSNIRASGFFEFSFTYYLFQDRFLPYICHFLNALLIHI